MGMTIDITDFEKGFRQLVEFSIPPEIENGMFKAMSQALIDAIEIPPQAPFLKGDLWASKHVNGVQVSGGEVSVVGGFNICYAARWHELTPEEDARINWTRTGAKQPGAKYLESKMATRGPIYLEIVAECVRRPMGG